VEWEFCDSEPVLECGPDDMTITLWIYNQEGKCKHFAVRAKQKILILTIYRIAVNFKLNYSVLRHVKGRSMA